MAYYSKEDEIKNLHDLKREMFNLIVRERDVKSPAQEVEAAKAYVQLARLQAELRGMLRPAEAPAAMAPASVPSATS
jgi:hypothetical protein